jgi:hypothetical protein
MVHAADGAAGCFLINLVLVDHAHIAASRVANGTGLHAKGHAKFNSAMSSW